MTTAAEILVIIVSVVLAIFLVLFCVALIYVIRLQRRVNGIVNKAEKVAGSMESAASAFERSAGPIAAIKLVSNIVSHLNRQRKEK